MSVSRKLRVLALAALVLLMSLPFGSAKYIADETDSTTLTCVWSQVRRLNASGNARVNETLVVTAGVNEGWYAVIAWGGCGGQG